MCNAIQPAPLLWCSVCESSAHNERPTPRGPECPVRVIRIRPEAGSCVPGSFPGVIEPDEWTEQAAIPAALTCGSTRPLPPFPSGRSGVGHAKEGPYAKGLVRLTPTWSSFLDMIVEIIPRVSIRIAGQYTNHVKGPQAFDRTFKIGDTVEKGSYNLVYLGTITKIGLKTIEIQDEYGRESVRLRLDGFAARNWDFDLAAVRKRNSEWVD